MRLALEITFPLEAFAFQRGTLETEGAGTVFKFKEKTFLSWIVNRLSLLLFGSLDGSAQPVAFTYHATTSTLKLETLSLNIGADWKVRVQ